MITKFDLTSLPFYHRKISPRFVKSAGFTMIELLISVTIMILLVSGGVATYINFNDKQIVLTESKELQAYLRSAQSRARVGDKPAGCGKLEGYSVRMSAGGSVVDLVAVCSAGDVARGQYNLDNGVTVGETIDVQFLVLHGGVNSEQTITLTSQSGLQYAFNVTQGGEITEGALVEE